MGPLQGVKVLEMAGLAPSPFGCMILADLGAEVLQVKRGGGGGGLMQPDGPFDRGKRMITVDLKNPDGKALLLELAGQSDVFVEGFRPGVAERLGIGPDDLLAAHPRLIYGRMTGWGQDGPLATRAGHDINYIALAGALEPLGRAGERPHAPLNLLGDFAGGGMLLAMGVMAALFERERSGRGQVIDAAMIDGANLLMSWLHGFHATGAWSNGRGENMLDGGAAFYDTYECADGKYVAVGCVEPHFYQELLTRLEIDERAAELAFQFDPTGWGHARGVLAAKFKERTRDQWAEVFADSDACVSPVLSPWEAHEHPHNRARKAFIEVDGLRQPAPAPRFSRTAADLPTGRIEGDPVGSLTAWGITPGHAAALCADGAVC
ncbi:CaiB/BaiF CoA transferase family protein [Nocardia concava]|uniref:CaiB/BaiF CoA transferase family protein n=1 Tax=Nocardia concava TaxID=257281 RepID=UPI0002F57858|nr:CaiB/BaiF CoA-transferase family protein [Nocardia concava]